MPWLYKMEQKYGKYAIPNLTLYVIICYAVGYMIQLSASLNPVIATLYSYITLNPYKILHGQVWRLVSWLLIPPGDLSILTLVVLYCYYSIGTLLERTWGTFRYNVFIFSGIIFTIIGSFVVLLVLSVIALPSGGDMEVVAQLMSSMDSMFSTYYVSMSIFLAFAITYPDMRMLFMFIIPIKCKVLGIIYVIMMAYQIIMAFHINLIYGIVTLSVIGFSLLNVLVFFIITRKGFRTPQQFKRQQNFKKRTMQPKGVTRHKCAICGRSEESDPGEEFRFCSKCEGNYEYCSKHIYTHVHVKRDNVVDFKPKGE
ncbi:MAG: rhomboid family intramembrane serine protease [Lachnospiraceae bacterium]|nr:rhomboid family intramembrane serine protease [Lachnospiraceae bacterium]